MTPSDRVLDLFAVPDDIRGLTGDSVVAGDLVLSPCRDPATARWLNPVLARTAVRLDERPGRRPRDLRIAVPVPARDGAWVVEGWAATRHEPGTTPCHDLDVVLATARLLHAEFAVAFPARPAGLDVRTDRRSVAERVALGPAEAVRASCTGAVAARVARHVDDTAPGPAQLVHRDLAGNVLLDARGAPVVIDVSPAWAPPRWAEAVCVVDSVVGGHAPATAVEHVNGTAGRQAVLRAIVFRLLSDPSDGGDGYGTLLAALQV